MPGRRSFLIGCGSLAVSPAIAYVALPVPAAVSPRLPLTDSVALTALTPVASAENPVLCIDGWDMLDETGSAAHRGAAVWVQISSSWKSVWR